MSKELHAAVALARESRAKGTTPVGWTRCGSGYFYTVAGKVVARFDTSLSHGLVRLHSSGAAYCMFAHDIHDAHACFMHELRVPIPRALSGW